MYDNSLINFIVIISLLMSHCWGTGLPYGSRIRRTDHNLARERRANWWVLTIGHTAGTNGLTARICNKMQLKFWHTHLRVLLHQSIDPRSTASIDGRINLSSSSRTPRRAGLIDHRRPMLFVCYQSMVSRSVSVDQLNLLGGFTD
jgi:hypothetical protein